MSTLSRPLGFALVGFVTMGLVACNNGTDTGRLNLAVTDAPVDNATAVVVEFTGVELHGPTGSQTITFDAPKAIDLLALTGNASQDILDEVELPAGRYQWLRLLVNAQQLVVDSYIDLDDGSRHSLYIPSGAETGLKLNSGFVVPAGGHADFTIDFDLRKSVHEPQNVLGDYVLRPSLRIVDNAAAGTVAGSVSGMLVGAQCTPVVYLFAGTGVTPDDEDGNAPNPVTSAIPQLNANTGGFDYEIGFVLAGEYTAAFSCDGEVDDPATDDAMTFVGAQNVSVSAGATASANFE